MDTKFFYIYLMLVIVATFSFTIIRCIFKRHELDIFFYPNEANNIIANKVYLATHILVNFLLGFLFGFEVVAGMAIKILVFEVYLYLTEHCDIFILSNASNLIIIVLISLISYIAGSTINKVFSNK
jgi:hypothetical protein